MNKDAIRKRLQSYPPINWDTPPAMPRPESWSAEDDAVTDTDIIETVSARYGWNWIDTVERLRKIDFDSAREAA